MKNKTLEAVCRLPCTQNPECTLHVKCHPENDINSIKAMPVELHLIFAIAMSVLIILKALPAKALGVLPVKSPPPQSQDV
jgi:hypothetical protein